MASEFAESAAQDEPPRPITAAVFSIGEAIERLEHQASRLIDRLAPISTPEANEKSPSSLQEAPIRAPMADDLSKHAYRVSQVADRLATATKALEV